LENILFTIYNDDKNSNFTNCLINVILHNYFDIYKEEELQKDLLTSYAALANDKIDNI
jgi:hypothetical protein